MTPERRAECKSCGGSGVAHSPYDPGDPSQAAEESYVACGRCHPIAVARRNHKSYSDVRKTDNRRIVGISVYLTDLGAALEALEAAEGREKALREALKQTQWGNCNFIYGKIYHMCPRCDQVEKNGHSPHCPVGLALADTEGPK